MKKFDASIHIAASEKDQKIISERIDLGIELTVDEDGWVWDEFEDCIAKVLQLDNSNIYQAVEVCFNYDTSNTVSGVIIHDDAEKTIIRLEDGREIDSAECHYRLVDMDEMIQKTPSMSFQKFVACNSKKI
jgi:hypothetical protein